MKVTNFAACAKNLILVFLWVGGGGVFFVLVYVCVCVCRRFGFILLCLSRNFQCCFLVFVQKLPSTIGELNRLRVLDLEENRLESLPHEIGKILRFFSPCVTGSYDSIMILIHVEALNTRDLHDEGR